MNWSQLRKLVIFRDGTTCQECKIEKVRLHVHHIDFDRTNNSPLNLKTLCQKCHEACHMKRKYENGAKMLFIKKLLITNTLTLNGDIAPLVGLTQPSISEFLMTTPKAFVKLNNFKKAINVLLKTNYSIEELFATVD